MAFFVNSHTPDINETGVYRNGQISINFNKRFQVQSVDWQKLTVNDSQDFTTVPGTLSLGYNSSGYATTVFFTPAVALLPNNKYSVYIFGKPNGILAYDGEQLDTTYSWEFITGTGLYDVTISGGLPSGESVPSDDSDPSGLLPSGEDVITMGIYQTIPKNQTPNVTNSLEKIKIEFNTFLGMTIDELSGYVNIEAVGVLT